MKLLATAFMLAAAVAPTGARAQAEKDPTKAQAGTYAIDPNHTQVLFAVTHFGFTKYTGIFAHASGQLTLDPKAIDAASLTVKVAIDSVNTTVPKLTDELKGPQWFDAARYPEGSFVSTKVTAEGDGKAVIAGNLTLHGVTKPVVLHATFIGAGVNPLSKKYTVGFEAKGELTRSDFGVSTYVPLVGDTVELTIAGAFEKQD